MIFFIKKKKRKKYYKKKKRIYESEYIWIPNLYTKHCLHIKKINFCIYQET